MENDPIKFIKQTFNVNDDDCRVQKAEALCKAITRLNGRLGIADLHNVAQQGGWDAQDLMTIASLLAKGGFFAEYFYLPALSGKTKWIP